MDTETKTTHTPGPWIHRTRARDGHADIIEDSKRRGFVQVGVPVAESPILDYPHENTQTANARLIAAAPELLEALETCEGNISSLLASNHPAVFGEWLKVVRAAIAKAKGGDA